MADRSRYDDEVVTKSAAAIVDRLGEQLAAMTEAIQQILERDIAELRGATDSENDALLRETLRVFLNDGCSYKAAADDLNLHSNSVKYRVQRAVDRRGRQITDDRLDVELALLVCHWFGAAVLEPDRRAKPTAK